MERDGAAGQIPRQVWYFDGAWWPFWGFRYDQGDMTNRRSELDFDWDRIKAERNFRKHRTSFADATEVFLDPLALSVPDREHSHGEERWVTVGQRPSGDYLVVIHTFDEISSNRARVRIISSRLATRAEIRRYQEGS